MDPTVIESLIVKAMPDAQVTVEDVRGDGAYLVARVSSEDFRDKTRLDQHRLVYAALRSVEPQIDSLTIQTSVP